jgi:hypothetical protein
VIVTACRENQVSFIGGGPLTVFTQALVDSLHGQRVPNRGGRISAFDLYTAVYDTVSEAVRTQYGREQEPELTVQKGVGPMAVAFYRGAEAPGAFDAPAEPAEGPGVRTVTPERAGRQFRLLMLNIPSPPAPAGAAEPAPPASLAPAAEAAALAPAASAVTRAPGFGQRVLQTARRIAQVPLSAGQTAAAHLPLVVAAAVLVPATALAVTAGVRYVAAPPTPPTPAGPAPVRGTGGPPAAPAVRLFYQRLDFGDVDVGRTSAVLELRLYNQGTAPLAITSFAVAGGGFAQANDCGARVLAGSNCAIRATFAPTAVGGQVGTLTITHDAPGSPHTIALSGTGRQPRPQ